MKKLLHILSYPVTAIFYLFFGLNLVVFDLIQRVCLKLFGYQAHKVSVDYFNALIVRLLHILGTRIHFSDRSSIPNNVPIIIVANHQSLWDIPPLIWFLRRYHPKFISKIELGKGLPSISYNLKYGGSVLIDRKNPKQSMEQITRIGKYVAQYHRSVVIFPEGTRSRTGEPKPFKRKGLQILFENAPEAYVLPVSISNSWKLQKYGMFPMPLGVVLKFKVHPAIKVSEYEPLALINEVERIVLGSIESV
ncbi:lysophospholipid acyltransferase family protein [Constantimarinum furrinae]|uniref:Glycerol acyltransferase n=1 Tax=Constantimarinum furrinae TaxID=2562285 RepID=A0A7G8PST7_9FLAO|nr:lysophospholipid acyltransferase family protein [Constantimarinum furrinae]QNJ97403.1 glycerol acyltransferase [Constantimarinum furrinae]